MIMVRWNISSDRSKEFLHNIYQACSLTFLHPRAGAMVARVPDFFVESQDGGGGLEARGHLIEFAPENVAVIPLVDALINPNLLEIFLKEVDVVSKFRRKQSPVGKVLPILTVVLRGIVVRVPHRPGVPQVDGGKLFRIGQLVEVLQVGWGYAGAVLHDKTAAAVLRSVPGSGLPALGLRRMPIGTENGIDRCDGGEESKGDDREELHCCNQRGKIRIVIVPELELCADVQLQRWNY